MFPYVSNKLQVDRVALNPFLHPAIHAVATLCQASKPDSGGLSQLNSALHSLEVGAGPGTVVGFLQDHWDIIGISMGSSSSSCFGIKTKTAKLNTEALLQEAPKEKPSDRTQKPMQNMQNQIQKPVDLPQQPKLEKPAPAVPKPASLGLPKKPQAGHIGVRCDFQEQLKILVTLQQNFDVTHVTHIPSIPSAGLGLEEAFYHRDQASSAAGALWSSGQPWQHVRERNREGMSGFFMLKDVETRAERGLFSPCCAMCCTWGHRWSQCQGKEMFGSEAMDHAKPAPHAARTFLVAGNACCRDPSDPRPAVGD